MQVKGVDLGYIQYFLRLLNTENDNNMKVRILFTLSTLIRNFPQAQKIFLEYGGIETIVKIFNEINSNNKIKIRSIELMSGLIDEKVRRRRRKYIYIFNSISLKCFF